MTRSSQHKILTARFSFLLNDGGRRRGRSRTDVLPGRRAILRAGTILLNTWWLAATLTVSPLMAAIPEPNAVVYGNNDAPLPPGSIIEAQVGGTVVATYVVGSIPEAGLSYILQVPLEVLAEEGDTPSSNVAQIGDLLSILMDGVPTGVQATVTQRGEVIEVDLDSDSNSLAPSAPALSSASHSSDVWSNDATVDLSWSGTIDPQGNLAGYSWINDRVPGTVPDAVVEISHTSDPHGLTIGPLADAADHWFHLAACDDGGNCSLPVQLGPLKIDTLPPGAPSAVMSTSHTESGGPDRIDMTWNPATDALSGVQGYGYQFTRGAADACPQLFSGAGNAVSSAPLDDGDWYFHLCGVDLAGNWGPEVHAGPYNIEANAPFVTAVRSNDSRAPSSGWIFNAPVTQVALLFSEAMNDPVGDSNDADVSNLANYRLLSPGEDGTFQTTGCGATDPDDVLLSPSGVLVDAATDQAILPLDPITSLPRGEYRAIACGEDRLSDLAGRFLDGDRDQTGGDDFVLDFGVRFDNLVLNPNFDEGTAGWVFEGDDEGDMVPSSEDVGGAISSGSAEIGGIATSSNTWQASQCVTLDAEMDLEAVAEVQLETTTAGTSALVALDLHDSGDCSGTPLESVMSRARSGDSAGAFLTLASPVTPSGAAGSVRLSLVVSTGSAGAATARFDAVSLHVAQPLLSNGFEGDSP